jgi:hypothetical protein
MAQTGFTPIVTYNTATATTIPSAANLAQGELAVNVTDKKLYTKDSGGNVVLLASNGGDVTGPASSTNLAIPTFSGTGGKTLLNNSGVTITAGVITGTGFTGALNGSLGATTPSTVVATTINKMAITAPATSSTLAIADGKTFTASKTLTLTGTDSTTMTFPATSATIARTDAAQIFTGVQTFNSGVTLGSGFTVSNILAGTIKSNGSNVSTKAQLCLYDQSAGGANLATGFSGAYFDYSAGGTTGNISYTAVGAGYVQHSNTIVAAIDSTFTIGANTYTVTSSGNGFTWVTPTPVAEPATGTLTNLKYTTVVFRANTAGLAVVGILSCTGLLKPQQATTAGAPAYVRGAIYFDTTLNKLRVGGATAWETITSV